jgi:hypothetical protein
MKKTFEAKCIRCELTDGNSNATFVVLNDKQPEPKPGERRILNARSVMQFAFQGDDAKLFKPGKPATITIEQSEESEESKAIEETETAGQ